MNSCGEIRGKGVTFNSWLQGFFSYFFQGNPCLLATLREKRILVKFPGKVEHETRPEQSGTFVTFMVCCN